MSYTGDEHADRAELSTRSSTQASPIDSGRTVLESAGERGGIKGDGVALTPESNSSSTEPVVLLTTNPASEMVLISEAEWEAVKMHFWTGLREYVLSVGALSGAGRDDPYPICEEIQDG